MKKLKILIIRNDHIGDLVLSTAVFREIKKYLPQSEITVVVSKENRSIIEKNKNIDKILELDMFSVNPMGFLRYFKASKKIKKEKFDIGIDLRGSLMNSFFLLWLSGIKKRIGIIDSHKNKIIQKIASFFLTVPISIGFFTSREHITKENIEIINKGLNLNSKNNMPEIILDKKDKEDVKKFINKNKLKKYICICPIASLEYKQWDLKNFEQIINWLKRYKVKILLLGTKKDKRKLKKLSKKNKNCQVVLDFNLRKMSELFKKSCFVLAQDGGPMHIAWTSGAKVIELVPQYPKRIMMGKIIPLKNSTILWARGKDMGTISLEEVKKAIKKILEK